jgi:hypothetical protein
VHIQDAGEISSFIKKFGLSLVKTIRDGGPKILVDDYIYIFLVFLC